MEKIYIKIKLELIIQNVVIDNERSYFYGLARAVQLRKRRQITYTNSKISPTIVKLCRHCRAGNAMIFEGLFGKYKLKIPTLLSNQKIVNDARHLY